jgi:hypothetical protein
LRLAGCRVRLKTHAVFGFLRGKSRSEKSGFFFLGFRREVNLFSGKFLAS